MKKNNWKATARELVKSIGGGSFTIGCGVLKGTGYRTSLYSTKPFGDRAFEKLVRRLKVQGIPQDKLDLLTKQWEVEAPQLKLNLPLVTKHPTVKTVELKTATVYDEFLKAKAAYNAKARELEKAAQSIGLPEDLIDKLFDK